MRRGRNDGVAVAESAGSHPPCCSIGLIGVWQIAASSGRSKTLSTSELPRPVPGRNRRSALAKPLAAGRKRLGDMRGDAPWVRLRSPRRSSFSRSQCISPRRCTAPSTRRSSPLRQFQSSSSPRSWSSGSATALARTVDRGTRSASSRSRSTHSTACAQSTQKRSRRCVRSTPRAWSYLLAPGSTNRAALYLQRRQDRRLASRGSAAVFGEWAGQNPGWRPDPRRQRSIRDCAPLRRGDADRGDGTHALCTPRPRRAPRRHLAIESRG